jgi:hypothetical protein
MAAQSYKAILRAFEASPDNVQWYFDQLPYLLKDDYSYEVSLAYSFLRTEKAQNMALYCGAVKLHRASSELAARAVNAQHLTREGFLTLYQNVFGKALPKEIRSSIELAEKIRDRVVHGKKVTDPEMREAHIDVLKYAKEVNDEIQRVAGFQPFGNMRGFKGRAQGLDNKTTRWLLKGLGFAIA